MKEFRVGLTRDLLAADGSLALGDLGLGRLESEPHISLEFFAEFRPEVTPEQIAGYDAVISFAPAYTRKTMQNTDLRLSVLARVGVGYDMLDLEALSDGNIIVTITPDGVRRPVACGIAGLILALAHQLPQKERLVRRGAWKERSSIKSIGLTGRTLGSVGLGNIGREMFRVLQPFHMIHLAADPYVHPKAAQEIGVQLVDLETLMKESDFVSVNCPLTPETRHLIGARQLAWMKPTAFFINTSRGAVVDQAALYGALKENRIRGAALDVFEAEPIAADDPLLALDNVIATPHSLCWTDECFRLMGESAVRSVLAVLRGEEPSHVVNDSVLKRPAMQAKLDSNRLRWKAALQENRIGHESAQADLA
ncbi:MAG TPA: NAD(P)-dependent oxidoreductase [Terriglobia bacterium]|nr:NAD(P)-dependent oxidoreductase [Terriglobia bacterium]